MIYKKNITRSLSLNALDILTNKKLIKSNSFDLSNIPTKPKRREKNINNEHIRNSPQLEDAVKIVLNTQQYSYDFEFDRNYYLQFIKK